jgi:SPP1 family phage portal protein
VQPMAGRYEVSTSNHGDTNDKHGDPSVVVEGDIIQQDKKGEYGGQVFNVAQGGDAKYMAWDHVVDSIELEQKTLKSNIFYFTSTPEITLEQMKSLGVFSGTALKMFFLPAHMKASKAATGWYGEYMQRRINYLKAALATIDQTLKPAASMTIVPRFTFFMPVNEAEMVDMINASKTGGVLSQETGVSLNPLVKDPQSEIVKIKEDEKSQLSKAFDE